MKSFPEWCPVCRYLRVDRASAQQLEPVMENYGLVLRPVRQSLSALAQGQTLAVSPYASGPPQPPPTPAAPDAFAFAERMVDRTFSAMNAERSFLNAERSVLNTERSQYLSTINAMADRATSTSLEALRQPPPPQQMLPGPAPQQAITAPPQPAPEASRSMGLNRLEQDIVAQTNNISTMIQRTTAAQQAHRAVNEGQWADRLGSILDILNEWMQIHHEMAARYRSQVQNGNSDNEIAAAITQFNMAADTAGTTYGGKCETKASGWGMTWQGVIDRIYAAMNASVGTQRQVEAPPPPTVVNTYHDNRQEIRSLTYHAPSGVDTIMGGVPELEGTQIPRQITEFAGQQHPDLQTDEDMRQRQSHNLPYDDDKK